MANFNACNQCLKLDEALQVLKKKLVRKNHLINLYKDLSNSIDLKKLKYSSEEVNQIYKTAINDAEVLRNRLSYFIEENAELSKAREDLRSQISDLERKCQLAEDKHNHILFINKQLVDNHTSSEKEINQLKNRLKKLCKCLIKYEPSNVEVKAILRLPTEKDSKNLQTSEQKKRKIITTETADPPETAGEGLINNVHEEQSVFDGIDDSSSLSDMSDTSFTSSFEDLHNTPLKKSEPNNGQGKEERKNHSSENIITDLSDDTSSKDMNSNCSEFQDKCFSETVTNSNSNHTTSIFDLESADLNRDMNCHENSKSDILLSKVSEENKLDESSVSSKINECLSPNTEILDSNMFDHDEADEALVTFAKQLCNSQNISSSEHNKKTQDMDCLNESFAISESELLSFINSEHNNGKPKSRNCHKENNSSILQEQMEDHSVTSSDDRRIIISERQNFRQIKDLKKSDSHPTNAEERKKYNSGSILNASFSQIPELLSPLKSVKSTSYHNGNLNFENDKKKGKKINLINSSNKSKPNEVSFDSKIYMNSDSFNEDQINRKNVESTVKHETSPSIQYSSERIPFGSNTFSSQYHFSDQNYLYGCCSCKESLYRDRANFLWNFKDNSSVQISVPIQIGNEKIGIEINDDNSSNTESREADGLKSPTSKYSITVHLKPEKVTSDFNCHCSFNSGFGNRNFVKPNDCRCNNDTIIMEKKGMYLAKAQKISNPELWNEWRKKLVDTENSKTRSHSSDILFKKNYWSFMSPKVFPCARSHLDIDDLTESFQLVSLTASVVNIKRDSNSLHDNGCLSTFSFTKKPMFYNPLSNQNPLSKDWVFGKTSIELVNKQQSKFNLRVSSLSHSGRESNILKSTKNTPDQISFSSDNKSSLNCKKYPTLNSVNRKAVAQGNPFQLEYPKQDESSSKHFFEKQNSDVIAAEKGIFSLKPSLDKTLVKSTSLQRIYDFKSNNHTLPFSLDSCKKNIESGTIQLQESLFSVNNLQKKSDISNKQVGTLNKNLNNSAAFSFSSRSTHIFTNHNTNLSAEDEKSSKIVDKAQIVEDNNNLGSTGCSPQHMKSNTSRDSEQVRNSFLVSDTRKSKEHVQTALKSISYELQCTSTKGNLFLQSPSTQVKESRISPSKTSSNFKYVNSTQESQMQGIKHCVAERLENGYVQNAKDDLKINVEETSEKGVKTYGDAQSCSTKKGKHKTSIAAVGSDLKEPPLSPNCASCSPSKKVESESEPEKCVAKNIKTSSGGKDSQCSTEEDTEFSGVVSNKKLDVSDEKLKLKNINAEIPPLKHKNKSNGIKRPYFPEVVNERSVKAMVTECFGNELNVEKSERKTEVVASSNENKKFDSEKHNVDNEKKDSINLKLCKSTLTIENSKEETEINNVREDGCSDSDLLPAKRRRITHAPNPITPSSKNSLPEKKTTPEKTSISLLTGMTPKVGGSIFRKESESGVDSISFKKNGFKIPKDKALKKRLPRFGRKNQLLNDCESLDQIFKCFQHIKPLSPLSPGDTTSLVRKNLEQLEDLEGIIELEMNSNCAPKNILNASVLEEGESHNKKDVDAGSNRCLSENICKNVNESNQKTIKETKATEEGEDKIPSVPESDLNKNVQDNSILVNCKFKNLSDSDLNNKPNSLKTLQRKVDFISGTSYKKDCPTSVSRADCTVSVVGSSRNKPKTVHTPKKNCLEVCVLQANSLNRNNSFNAKDKLVTEIETNPKDDHKDTDDITNKRLITEFGNKENSLHENKSDQTSVYDCSITSLNKEYETPSVPERTFTKNENKSEAGCFKHTNDISDGIISRSYKNVKVYSAKKKSNLIKEDSLKQIDNNVSSKLINDVKHEGNDILKPSPTIAQSFSSIQSSDKTSNDIGNDHSSTGVKGFPDHSNNLSCDSPPFRGFYIDTSSSTKDVSENQEDLGEDYDENLLNNTNESENQNLIPNLDSVCQEVLNEQNSNSAHEINQGKRKMIDFSKEDMISKKIKLNDEVLSENGTLLECKENIFLCSLKYYCSEVLSKGWANDRKPVIDKKSISDVKFEINRLFGTSEDNEYLHLNKVVEPLVNSSHFQPRPFAKAVIDILCQDSGKEMDAYPKMTRATKLCLLYTISYIGYNHHFLFELLKVFEEHLCAFYDKTLSALDGVKLVTFYGTLCRSYNLDNKGKQVLYDILYARHIKAYPMIYKLLKIWPTILPKSEKSLAEDCLLTQTIVFILMSSKSKPSSLSNEKFQALYQTNNLRTYLNKFYGYDYEFQRRDTLCDKIVNRISEKGCRMALILLAQCEGFEWAVSMVEKKLFPLLYDWLQYKLDYSTAQQVALTIAMIVRAFPLSKAAYFVKTTLDLLEKVLHFSPDNNFSETVIEAISLLRRHNLMMCALILIKWIPKSNTITKKTLDHVRNILSVKSIVHWRSFYFNHHTYNEAQRLPS